MKNLLKCEDYEHQIVEELKGAKIEVVRVSGITGELIYSFLIGKLGAVIFERYWDSWSTEVNVPLDIIKEIYQDPALKKGLHISGWSYGEKIHDGSISYLDEEGRTLIARKELPPNPNLQIYKVLENNPMIRIVEDPAAEGKPFITKFFIYSDVALRLFADALKKHKLV